MRNLHQTLEQQMKGWQVEENGLAVQKTFPYPGGEEVKIYINKNENVYEVWVQIHDRNFQPHGFLRETFTSLELAQTYLYEKAQWWDKDMSDISQRRVPFGGGGDNIEEEHENVLRDFFNNVMTSGNFMNEMRSLAQDGEASCGEVDCCLQKWSEEIGEIFEIEPYEGYMGYVSEQDNGVPTCGDLISYYDEALVMRYVTEELDWYELRYPDKKNEVEELRGLFQCESLLMNKGNTELYNQAEFAFDELAKLIKRFVVHEHEKDDFLNRLAEAKAAGLFPVRDMMQRLKQYREKYHFSAPLSCEEKRLMNHLLNCW